MADLRDLIMRRRMVDGGVPGFVTKQQLAQQRADQAAQIQGGAFSSTPPPLPTADNSLGAAPTPGINPEDMAIATQGAVPRLFGAGVHDVASGVDNALAMAAQAVGADNVAASQRLRANEHQLAAERMTQDQIKNASDIRDLTDIPAYVGGQIVRGAPMLGAMAAGGALAGTAGLPAMAGIAVPSAVANIGGEYGRAHAAIDQQLASGQIDQAKADELRASVPAHAAIGGGIGAVLDTLAFGYVLKANPIAKAQLAGLVSQSLPGHILKSLAVAGGDAAAREYVDQVATKLVLQNPDAFHVTPDDKTAMLNAAASQASAMAPFAVAGHVGSKVGDAVGRAGDALGDAYRKLRPTPPDEPPGAPPTPPPSMGARAGAGLAAVIDDPAKLAQFGGQAVDALKELPGVGQAIQQGQDFFGALGQSRRVGKVLDFLDNNAQTVRQGFDDFRAGLGDKAKTDNIEMAYDKYRAMLSHAIGAEGIDTTNLSRLAGEKLGTFISGFNSKLPEIESNTGAFFNTAKGVAGVAADKVGDAVSSFKQGFDQQRSFNATPEENSGAVRDLADQFTTPDVPGVKKSTAGALNDDAKALRSGLNWNDSTTANERTLLAKKLSQVVSDRKAFDSLVRTPEARAALGTAFDMTPEHFTEHVYDILRNDPKATKFDDAQAGQDKTFDAKQLDTGDTAVDNISAEDGENLNDLLTRLAEDHGDSNEILHIGALNEGNERHPGMTPDRFAGMLSTARIARDGTVVHGSKDADFGGNASVLVTRTKRDKETGQKLSETSTPAKINFLNVAKAWAGQREMSDKGKRIGETGKEKFDNNFKDGLSAMLGGWTEHDEAGHPIEVKVQPANQHTENGKVGAVPRDDVKGWLRDNSVVGFNKAKPGEKATPRTFGEVADEGKANQAVSLSSAVDNYHAAMQKAEEEGWKPRALLRKQISEAGKVGSQAVERVHDEIADMSPQDQERAIKNAIDFVSNPDKATGTPPDAIRALPREILEHGKTRIITELSELDKNVVQPKMRGEQETSVDNPDFNSEPGADSGELDKHTTDLSGQQIRYDKTQEAGKGVKPLAKPAIEQPNPKRGMERSQIERNAVLEDQGGLGGLFPKSETPIPPVTGDLGTKPNEAVAPKPEAPVAPVAQRQALDNLRQLYKNATTDGGKALLAKAGAIVSKEPMSTTEYALLSKGNLKPSDVKLIIGAKRWTAEPGAEPPKA